MTKSNLTARNLSVQPVYLCLSRIFFYFARELVRRSGLSPCRGPNSINGIQVFVVYVVLASLILIVCGMKAGKLAWIHVTKIMTCWVLWFYWGSLPFKLMLILNFFYYHLFLILKLNLTESNSKLRIKKRIRELLWKAPAGDFRSWKPWQEIYFEWVMRNDHFYDDSSLMRIVLSMRFIALLLSRIWLSENHFVKTCEKVKSDQV